MKRWHWFALAYVSIMLAFVMLFETLGFFGPRWTFVFYLHGVFVFAIALYKGLTYK